MLGKQEGTGREHGRSAVSMETMDFYGFTCKGGAVLACKGGAGPYARRARHEEDQAQGAGTATQRTKLKEQAVRGRAPETQVGLSRSSVTIQLCDSYCLGLGLEELVARQLSSCAVTAGGVVVYAIVGFG